MKNESAIAEDGTNKGESKRRGQSSIGKKRAKKFIARQNHRKNKEQLE